MLLIHQKIFWEQSIHIELTVNKYYPRNYTSSLFHRQAQEMKCCIICQAITYLFGNYIISEMDKYKNIFLSLYFIIFYIIILLRIAINGIGITTISKFSYSHKMNSGNIIVMICFV